MKRLWVIIAILAFFSAHAQENVVYGYPPKDTLQVLKFRIGHTTGEERNKALIRYHDALTNDGETQTLNLFYAQYDDSILDDIKARDYQLANVGNGLSLHLPYAEKNASLYDEYVRLAAPRERAFVALQRMIAKDVAHRNWWSATAVVNMFAQYFGAGNRKIADLLSVLNAVADSTVVVNSLSASINAATGTVYAPVISADDKLLYFCGKHRTDNIGGEDIFVSAKIDGGWAAPEIVPNLSTPNTNEAPVNISTDGNTLLMFRSGKLCYAEKTTSGWSEPIEFPKPVNSPYWQSDAMISADGKALFFVSTRPGGYNLYTNPSPGYHGDDQFPTDIYVSLLNDQNKWGDPINLGAVINTPYSERGPFLHADMKTLYFSSDGHGGLGKLDVFKSTRLADSCWDCWSEPINLGKEINTPESDWCYKIATNGEKAYFAKSPGTGDDSRIYCVSLPKKMRPGCVATLSGRVTDKTKQPVVAEIIWEDLETGKKAGHSKCNPVDGSYFIALPLGKNYGYYVEKEGYYPVSGNIDLRDSVRSVLINVDFTIMSNQQMIEDGTPVTVNNLFFSFAKSTLLPNSFPELRRVAQFINANKLRVEIGGHTDNVGDDAKNRMLSEQRARAVRDFLVTEGCLPGDLTVTGYGKAKPVATNDNDEGRAKNRRVELRFKK